MNHSYIHPSRKYYLSVGNIRNQLPHYLWVAFCAYKFDPDEIENHKESISKIKDSDVEAHIVDAYRDLYQASQQRCMDLTEKAATIFSGSAIVVAILSSVLFSFAEITLGKFELAFFVLSILSCIVSIKAALMAMRVKEYQAFAVDFGIKDGIPKKSKTEMLKLLIYCTSNVQEIGNAIADYVKAAMYYLILALLLSFSLGCIRYVNMSTIVKKQDLQLMFEAMSTLTKNVRDASNSTKQLDNKLVLALHDLENDLSKHNIYVSEQFVNVESKIDSLLKTKPVPAHRPVGSDILPRTAPPQGND